MKISDKVRFLEEELEAFEKIYREEIERELKSDEIVIDIGNLTCYDWAYSLEDQFYPIRILLEKKLSSGLIITL